MAPGKCYIWTPRFFWFTPSLKQLKSSASKRSISYFLKSFRGKFLPSRLSTPYTRFTSLRLKMHQTWKQVMCLERWLSRESWPLHCASFLSLAEERGPGWLEGLLHCETQAISPTQSLLMLPNARPSSPMTIIIRPSRESFLIGTPRITYRTEKGSFLIHVLSIHPVSNKEFWYFQDGSEILLLKTRYDGEWVLIGNPVTDDSLSVRQGEVLWHSKDRNEVYRKARELKPTYSAILFFGSLPKDAAILL